MDILCKTGKAHNFKLDVPAICPRCGRDLSAIEISTNFFGSANFEDKYAVVAVCQQCKNAIYFDVLHAYGSEFATIVNSYPPIQIFDLPAGIESLFSDFVRIYCQAAAAEARNYSDICGMGFRKALELLVKQYAIKTYPENEEAICNESLSQTISRIQNAKIQTLAKAATWLGNDQAHLQVTHPEYNVADIKAFIKALCYHILMEEEVFKAQELVTKPRQ